MHAWQVLVCPNCLACRSRREGTRVSSILAARERQVTASSCIAHPSSCCVHSWTNAQKHRNEYAGARIHETKDRSCMFDILALPFFNYEQTWWSSDFKLWNYYYSFGMEARTRSPRWLYLFASYQLILHSSWEIQYDRDWAKHKDRCWTYGLLV